MNERKYVCRNVRTIGLTIYTVAPLESKTYKSLSNSTTRHYEGQRTFDASKPIPDEPPADAMNNAKPLSTRELDLPVIMMTLPLRSGILSAVQFGFGGEDSRAIATTKSQMTPITMSSLWCEVADGELYVVWQKGLGNRTANTVVFSPVSPNHAFPCLDSRVVGASSAGARETSAL